MFAVLYNDIYSSCFDLGFVGELELQSWSMQNGGDVGADVGSWGCRDVLDVEEDNIPRASTSSLVSQLPARNHHKISQDGIKHDQA